MPKTASINVRIEPALKERAEQIFETLGVSTSDAIGMFFRQTMQRMDDGEERRLDDPES